MHKGDHESGLLKQWPTFDITSSIWSHVGAHVDKVKSHLIQSALENIAELHDLHHFESDAEHLESIDSLVRK
jgi:hypothetical protein